LWDNRRLFDDAKNKSETKIAAMQPNYSTAKV